MLLGWKFLGVRSHAERQKYHKIAMRMKIADGGDDNDDDHANDNNDGNGDNDDDDL